MKALGEEDHQFNFSQSIDIGADVSIGEVWDAVAWMASRHESFRTLFAEMPGGRVGQRVLDAVEIPVRIIERNGDPAAAHEDDAVNDWVSRRFRHVAEIPLRVCLVGPADGPKRLVLVISHMCADFFGIRLAVGETARVLGGADPLSFPPPVQPREVAAFQHSERGRNMSARAIEYWIGTLLQLPPMRVDPGFADRKEVRFWQGRLSSRFLPCALASLASRFRVGESTVLLSAASLVLGRMAGTDRPGFMLMCGNRVTAEDRRNVSPRVLEGLFSVDVSGGDFADLLKRVQKASLRSYQHSQYDKIHLVSKIRSTGADRCRLHRTVFYNDARMAGGDVRPPATPPANEAFGLGDCRVHALTDNRGEEDIALHIHQDRDEMIMTLTTDTGLVGPQAIRHSLREIERLILDAVSNYCRS
jgi:hypothetical protein